MTGCQCKPSREEVIDRLAEKIVHFVRAEAGDSCCSSETQEALIVAAIRLHGPADALRVMRRLFATE